MTKEQLTTPKYRRFTDEQLLSAEKVESENYQWKITVANFDFYLSDAEYIKDLKHNLAHAKAMYTDLKNYVEEINFTMED